MPLNENVLALNPLYSNGRHRFLKRFMPAINSQRRKKGGPQKPRAKQAEEDQDLYQCEKTYRNANICNILYDILKKLSI